MTKQGTFFLKLLCILTIIGAAVAILLTFLAAWVIYTQPDSGNATASKEGTSSEVASLTLLVHLLGAVACILGAVKMMKLKRLGFYFFLPGVLVPDIVSGIIFGKIYFTGFLLVVFIVPLIFIILFGLYFNKMK